MHRNFRQYQRSKLDFAGIENSRGEKNLARFSNFYASRDIRESSRKFLRAKACTNKVTRCQTCLEHVRLQHLEPCSGLQLIPRRSSFIG